VSSSGARTRGGFRFAWAILAVLAAVASGAAIAFWSQTPAGPQPAAPPVSAGAGGPIPGDAEPPPGLLGYGGRSTDRIAGYDDSGFGGVKIYINRSADPRELLQLNRLYEGAGYRGAERLEWDLRQKPMALARRFDTLQAQSRFYLYEGDYRKAAEVLTVLRALVDANRSVAGDHYAMVRWVQGVTALRRAESENCVACGCEASCIFPLQPRAYHAKPEGARDAVCYFSEYLQIHPDYVGAKWLLNVAFMTLGEYPDKVPPEHLLPLEPFRSEFDMGRFRDVAAQAGVDRLDMSGRASSRRRCSPPFG
jgi:hypothetical protein